MPPIASLLFQAKPDAWDLLPVWLKVVLVAALVILGVCVQGLAYSSRSRRSR